MGKEKSDSNLGSSSKSGSEPESESISIISYNIRCDILETMPGEADYWPERRLILQEYLKRARPDILGCQELMNHQAGTVLDGLRRGCTGEYGFVGRERDDTWAAENCGIFYRADRFKLFGSGTFWLSDTPSVVGSVTWGNECPRIATWAVLDDILTGSTVTIVNTHLDHISAYSRMKSAELLMAVFGGIDNLILMGDFNEKVDSDVYRKMSTVWTGVGKGKFETWGGYKDPVKIEDGTGMTIDWLLYGNGINVLSAAVGTYNIDGKYASDHLPLEVQLRLV